MDIIQTIRDYQDIEEKAYGIVEALHLSKVKKGIGKHLHTIEFDNTDLDDPENATFYISWDETWRYGGRSASSGAN